MTPERYAQVIAKLGLSQVECGRVSRGTIRAPHAAGSAAIWSVPKAVAMLLEFMVRKRAKPGEVEGLI